MLRASRVFPKSRIVGHSIRRYGTRAVQLIEKYELETYISKNQGSSSDGHPPYTIIDVREPDEVKATGIIPTAINIPCMYNSLRIFLFSLFYLV